MMQPSDNHLRLVVNRGKHLSPFRGLYLLTDEEPRLVERLSMALTGGVGAVQFRCKKLGPDRQRELGGEVRALCRAAGIPFIVNDDVILARALDADGVHLGQDDLTLEEARRLLPPGRIIGISTHDLDEALGAQEAGADYIGFGAMYPTGSKEVRYLPGPGALAAIRDRITIPVVAIGGITRDNGAAVIDAGADAVAVISAVMSSPHPALAAAEISTLFNRRLPYPRGGVLTVAGSDSGGGAGIQADLKTITLLGSYGASVITALTAQNTRGVTGIHPVPPDFVAAQLEAVLSDIPVHVVKSGMLPSPEIIDTMADMLKRFAKRLLVADPVMVAKGGASLTVAEAVSAFRRTLLPMSYLLTPNIPEAEQLTGMAIRSEDAMEEAARVLHRMGAANVLLKGGHLEEGHSVDILWDGRAMRRFTAPRTLTRNTHGTGCTLASAIATFLAQGEPLPVAVARAKEFITSAIRLATPLGSGHGPVNHFAAALEIRDQGPGNRDQ